MAHFGNPPLQTHCKRTLRNWSGRDDLNLRPLGPEPSQEVVGLGGIRSASADASRQPNECSPPTGTNKTSESHMPAQRNSRRRSCTIGRALASTIKRFDPSLLAWVVGDRPFRAPRLADATAWARSFALVAVDTWLDPSRWDACAHIDSQT